MLECHELFYPYKQVMVINLAIINHTHMNR